MLEVTTLDLVSEYIYGTIHLRCWHFLGEGRIIVKKMPTEGARGRDIHTECSKQFQWNLYSYVSGQNRPFWAALKLL